MRDGVAAGSQIEVIANETNRISLADESNRSSVSRRGSQCYYQSFSATLF
jgi:hypothetical protein